MMPINTFEMNYLTLRDERNSIKLKSYQSRIK
jgi:hypothetical protein